MAYTRITNAEFNKRLADICLTIAKGNGVLTKHQYQIERIKVTTTLSNGSMIIWSALSPNIDVTVRSDNLFIGLPPGTPTMGLHADGNEIDASLKGFKQYKFAFRGATVLLDFG